MTQGSIKGLLRRLVEFYDVEFAEVKAREYLRVLGEYPEEVAEDAVSDIIDELEQMPSLHRLRRALGRRMHEHQVDEATREKLAEFEALERLADRQTPPEVYALLREMTERMSMNNALSRGERALAKQEVQKWAQKEREAKECSSPAT